MKDSEKTKVIKKQKQKNKVLQEPSPDAKETPRERRLRERKQIEEDNISMVNDLFGISSTTFTESHPEKINISEENDY
jgi:hypothetical protein